MLSFTPSRRSGTDLRILCLGAHSDDLEIGCGGTLLRLLREHERVHVRWLVFSGVAERRREALRSAARFLKRARTKEVSVDSFRDGYFPVEWGRIKDHFERLKAQLDPDLIFTHYRHDLHQDHRVISDLTWNTFRGRCVLEYEIPKYDGDLGQPNVFVSLAPSICTEKIRCLTECFPSQRSKPWFTGDLFRSLLRLRGMEAAAPSGYAEAFYGRKLRLF